MTDADLRRKLHDLQAELRRVALDEEAARERLRDLADEIDHVLDVTPPGIESEGLLARLRESLSTFETQYPDLAVLTARVIDQLVKLGI